MKKLICAIICIALILSLAGCGAADGGADVRVYGIKGPTGVGLVNMMKKDGYDFHIVGSPDEIVGKITTGEVDIAAMPTNLAAKLFEKTGGKIKIIALNTLGVLSFIEKGGPTVNSVADLKGRVIFTTGQGSNPEYILKYLLTSNGLDPEKDVVIKYFDDNDTLSAQMLTLAEETTVAMIAQPAATALILKAAQSGGKAMTKVLDVNDEWNRIARENSLVMGCMVVRSEFAEKNPEKVKKFLADYKKSVAAVGDDLTATAELCAEYELIPSEAIAEKAIPECNVVCISGADIKPSAEPYFELLYKFDPSVIGGKMPDESFYYTE